MATFVTFPGTAGNYVSTDDVNLLDADTAHLQQSVGSWAGGDFPPATLDTTHVLFGDTAAKLNLTAPSASPAQRFADETIIAGSGVATTEGVERSASVWVYTTTAGLDAKLTLLWNSAVPALISATNGPRVPLTQNGWTQIAVTGTAPAATATAGCQFDIGVVGGGNVPAGDYWSDQACVREGSDAAFVPSLRVVGDLSIETLIAPNSLASSQELFSFCDAAVDDGYRVQLFDDSQLVVQYGNGAGDPITNFCTGFSFAVGTTTKVSVRWQKPGSSTNWALEALQDDVSVYTADGAAVGNGDYSNASPPSVGAFRGSSAWFDGDMYWCELRDGIGGPVVARFDAEDVPVVAQLPSP